MLLQCYMQSTATPRVIENEMQAKNSCVQGPARSVKSMMTTMGARPCPNFLGQEPPAHRLPIFEGNFADYLKSIGFRAAQKGQNQGQYQNQKASATQHPYSLR
jgi:hypothetical protein